MPTMNRRSLIVGAASPTIAAPYVGLAQGAPAIHVLKDPNCGCCTAWIEILEREGFTVDRGELRDSADAPQAR